MGDGRYIKLTTQTISIWKQYNCNVEKEGVTLNSATGPQIDPDAR